MENTNKKHGIFEDEKNKSSHQHFGKFYLEILCLMRGLDVKRDKRKRISRID